jgi:CDP-glycerol glycerophosphotransferase (TagB/SpsB family)
MVFLQDADTKEAFDNNGRADHAFLTGTPKIDALLEAKDKVQPLWPIGRTLADGTKPMRVIWAPHHSYGPNWLNFGHFTNQKDSMLEYAKSHPEIDFVLRPHPFLFGTLTGRDLMTPEELSDWRMKWDSLPNTFTDVDGPFTSLALASDAMITDGVSFIAEYPLVTNKSVIFWEKPEHWEFSPLGKIAAETAHVASSMEDVVRALELTQAGKLMPKEAEIKALIKAVRPGKTTAAKAIVDLVLGDYTSKAPL